MNNNTKQLLINILLVAALFSFARAVNIAIYSDNQIIRDASDLQNLLGIIVAGLVGVIEPKWLLISSSITLILGLLTQSLVMGSSIRRVLAIAIPLIVSLSIYLTTYHSKPIIASPRPSPSIKESSWEEKQEIQKNKNRQVANLVGFQIIREDDAGNQAPLDGGIKYRDYTFKIKYNNKVVLSAENAAYHMDVVFHETLGDDHLVLFEHNGEGVGGEKQSLINFSKDKATIIQSDYSILGSLAKIEKHSDSIVLKDFAGCGKRKIGTYKDQKIAWHNETIKVPNAIESAKKYALNNDVESILLIPEVNSTLRKLMRDKYTDLESLLCNEWSYRRTTDLSGDLAIIKGVPQRFGRYPVWDDAFLSVNSSTGEIYAAYLAHGYDRSPNVLYGFSTKPALFAELPKEFKDWMKQYPDAQEKWTYGE